MNPTEYEARCFLCGHEAIYKETDYGNRRYYSCSNPICGEYEISRTAMHRLENAEEFKEEAIPKANKCRDTEEILEIIATSPTEITATFKPRSEGPG